jgi:molybdopterin converting factor small subunit
MATIRLFAAARQAAGTGRDELDGSTVADILSAATTRYGAAFAAVLPSCRVWVNGELADEQATVGDGDEVAILPPVSGGADDSVLRALDLDALRARRAELQAQDDVVSYVRRITQARLDLLQADFESTETDDRDISGELREVLSRQLIGGQARPPRSVTPEVDLAESPLARELDEICTAGGFARLGELDAGARDRLVETLQAFEVRVSADRRARFVELDALNAELVRRYRDGEASID